MNGNPRTLFDELRSSFTRRVVQRYLADTILIALFLCVAALAGQRFTPWPGGGLRLYSLLIFMAAFLALLYTIRLKKGLKEELMALEKQLDLKELLSTWHEYRQSESDNPWTEKLETETRNLFKRISPSRAFPGPLTAVHLLIPLSAVSLILLAVMNPVSFRAGKPFDSPLVRLGTRLERAAGRMTPVGRSPQEYRGRDLAGELEKLAGNLKAQKMRKEELLRIAHEMKLKIQNNNTLLSHEIQAELGDDSLSDKQGSSRERSPEKEREKLEQLQEELEKIFQNELPVSLSRKMEHLGRSLQLEELLDEVSDELSSGLTALGPESRKTELKDEGQGAPAGQGKEQDISDQSLAEDPGGTGDQKTSDTSGPAGRGGPDRQEGTGTHEDLLEMFNAGRGSSSEKSDKPGDFNRRPGPVKKEKSDMEAEDPLIIQVKSMPVMQQAQVEPEQVIRNYGRELEAVLNKEDIPPADRETIKNYFLSIGLRKENDAREDH